MLTNEGKCFVLHCIIPSSISKDNHVIFILTEIIWFSKCPVLKGPGTTITPLPLDNILCIFIPVFSFNLDNLFRASRPESPARCKFRQVCICWWILDTHKISLNIIMMNKIKTSTFIVFCTTSVPGASCSQICLASGHRCCSSMNRKHFPLCSQYTQSCRTPEYQKLYGRKVSWRCKN